MLPAPERFVRPENKTVHYHRERAYGNSNTRAIYNRHIGNLLQEELPILRYSKGTLNPLNEETIEELICLVSRDTSVQVQVKNKVL